MSITIFPKQNIPDSQKNKKWVKDNINAMMSYQDYTLKYNRERKKDYENYQMYNGVIDVKSFEYVTNVYGITSPARLVNHPIIAPKVDLLVGEFMSQPLQFSVESIDKDSISGKLEKKVGLVLEKVLKPIRMEVEKELGMTISEDDYGFEIPDDIDAFMQMNFREQTEEIVENGLNYLIQRYSLKHLFKTGMYDLSITGKEFYHVSVKQGDPYVRRVDPRSLIYDVDTETENLQDCNWVAEERYLTVNEILDEYGPWLNVENVNLLEELRMAGMDDMNRYNKPYQWYFKGTQSSPLRIRVVSAEWKSLKTLNFKISENKYDPEVPFRKLLPDDYKKRKGDKIQRKTVTDIWLGTQIGHDILVNYRRKPNQIRKESSYSNAPLSYVGVIQNNIDGITLSVVDALKNIQVLYNIVMYHIELSLARSGGKAVVYDTSQKPDGLTLDDVFYHAKNSGVIPINSKQEGNQLQTFNQFQQIDFTLSNSVQQLLNLKMMLEQTAESVTGISRAREGFTKTDAVGVNERNVLQSSLVTQPLIALHSKAIEYVFQQLADLMKIAWNDGKKISYVLGDYRAKFFEVTSDIRNRDMGIFVTNTGKNKQDKEAFLQFAQAALQTGGVDFLDVIKVYNSDTAREAEAVLESGLTAMKEQQAQMQEQQMEMQQQAQQAEAQAKQAEQQGSEADRQTKIEVAKINADTMLKTTQMKIDGGQETQDFRQKHDMDMSMLGASNDMGKQEFTKELEAKDKSTEQVLSDAEKKTK